MLYKYLSVVLLFVTFECNGHLSTLTDILGGAHKHVQSTVHNVAGQLLGGLNLNFQGHVGGQRYPNRPQPNGNQETIVVVVEEDNPNGQQYPRPNQNGYGNHDNNNYNHPSPGYNNQGHWNGNNNGYHNHNPYGMNQHNHGQNNYGNPNQNNYGRPEQYPNNNQNNYPQHPDQTNQEYPNNYGNEDNDAKPHQQENHNNNYQPDQTTHKNDYPHPNNQQSTPKPQEQPTFGTIHKIPTENPVTSEKSPGKDEPLFVPLNPNEYIYGGDKINVNGPKRETDDKKPASDDDEEFPIDVRFQDQ